VGGRAQNVSYIFQCVFEGGHENVSLHFEVWRYFDNPPTKTTPGGRSATNFTFKGGSPKMYLTFWYGAPWKVAVKGWWLYIYNYIYTNLYMYGMYLWWRLMIQTIFLSSSVITDSWIHFCDRIICICRLVNYQRSFWIEVGLMGYVRHQLYDNDCAFLNGI
jgi:hypothetical protein